MLRRNGLAAGLGCICALSCTPTARPIERAQTRADVSQCADRDVSSVADLLRAGRIERATAAFSKLSDECRPGLGDAWGDIALALAELGRADQARAEAVKIGGSTAATAGARAAATRAVEHSHRYAEPGGDLRAMLETYDRALDAEQAGNGAAAIRDYLEAWSRFRPNPAALVRAGRVAERSGDRPRAQRLYDRALAEHGKVSTKAPRASVHSFHEVLDSAHVEWVLGGKAFAVVVGGLYQVMEPTSFELLAAHAGSPSRSVRSGDDRLLAIWKPDDRPHIDVVHLRSGHRMASFATERDVTAVASDADLTRIALSAASKIQVFDTAQGRQIAELAAPSYPNRLHFLDAATLWGSFESDKRQICWNVERNEVVWQHELAARPRAASSLSDRFVYVLPDSKKEGHGRALALDLRTGKSGRALELREFGGIELASRDVLVVSGRGLTTAYRVDSWQPIAKTSFGDASDSVWPRPHWPGAVILTDRGSGSRPRQSRIWEPATGKLSPFTEPKVLVTPSGRLHDQTRSGRAVSLLDPDTIEVTEPDGRRRRLSRPRPQELGGIAVQPSGRVLVIGDGRGIRTLAFDRPALGWLGARGLPNANLGYTDDGRSLLATGDAIVVVDAKAGAVAKRFAHATASDARISPDGSLVVALGAEHNVIWDLRTGRSIVRDPSEELPEAADLHVAVSCCGGALTLGPKVDEYFDERAEVYIGSLALSGDGSRVAISYTPVHRGDDLADASGDDGAIAVFDRRSRKRIALLELMHSGAGEVAIDRAGRFVAASTSLTQSVLLYHVDPPKRFELGGGYELSFSRDGTLLVGLDAHQARVWRTSDGALLGTIVLSPADPDSGAFIANDGRVEWIGKPGSVYLACLVGDTEVAFDVCADRLVTPGLLASVLH